MNVKYEIKMVVVSTEDTYLEIKKLIESGEMQREAVTDKEVQSIKVTIQIVN